MLKDRGHKGSWKGGMGMAAHNSQRGTKKKSYGNIHSINDRGIHEIYETFGGASPNGAAPGTAGGGGGGGGDSAPTSPWSSPLMGRKSVVTSAPTQFGERGGVAAAGGKLLTIQS